MAVHIDRIRFMVRARGIVHHHYVWVLQVLTHQCLVKLLWRILLLLAQGLTLCIARCPRKLLHGFTQAYCQDMIDRTQLLRLHAFQLGLLLTLRCQLTQRQTILAQLQAQQWSHTLRIIRIIRFWHRLRRHQAVLAHYVYHTTERTAVWQWILKQPIDQLVWHRLLGIVYHGLQEEVRLLVTKVRVRSITIRGVRGQLINTCAG